MEIGKRYEIYEKLGQGGMGVVYRAKDRLTGEIVALKQVLLPEKKLDFATRGSNNDIRFALALEFRTLASLRHPYIVSVLDYGFNESKQPYYTMTLLEDAKTITDYAQGLPPSGKIALLVQVLEALVYLHRQRIIHRDIKPENILMNRDGTVKVMDFGLAMADRTDATNLDDKLAGTVAYMSPELFLKSKPSVQSDLYAVGMIAYELFANSYPFAKDFIGMLIYAILNDVPDTTNVENPALALWLERMLAKAPEDRYQSAEDALRTLCNAVGYPLPPEGALVRESLLQGATFVGRNQELQTLRRALNDVTQGANAFYLVGGESGIGKSRLVEELRTRALTEGVLVLKGQGVGTASLPFQYWRSVVHRLLLFVPVSDEQAGILKELVPDINSILEHDIPDAPKLEGLAHQQRLVNAIVELIQACAVPTLLILEDLQWAWESLLPIHEMLRLREQLSHLMFIGTYRDDECPDMPDELLGTDVILLKRFGSPTIAELSYAILGDLGKQPPVLEFLARESEGNIFFILEAIRALAENVERLSEIEQAIIPERVLTSGMQEVLQHRLNQMPEEYRPLLNLSAIIGRQIDKTLVHHIFPDARLDMWLYLGQVLAIFEVQDNIWQFAHDKLREIVLSTIPQNEQAALHWLAAREIENIYPNNKAYYTILLEHWYQAGELDKEIYYLNFVAEDLIDVHSHYKQAHHLLGRSLTKLANDDGRRIRLQNLQGLTYGRQSRFSDAETVLLETYNLAKRIEDTLGMAHSLGNLGLVAIYQVKFSEAHNYLTRSYELFRSIDVELGLARTLLRLGLLHYIQADNGAARAFYEQSLELYRKSGSNWGIAINQVLIGLVLVKPHTLTVPPILVEGLSRAYAMMSMPSLTFGITAYVHLLLARREIQFAAQLVGLMENYSSGAPDVLVLLAELMPLLQTQLEPMALEIELAKGRKLDLQTVVAQILAEYS